MLAARIKLYPKLPWTRNRKISCKDYIFQRIFNERKFEKRIANQQNLETIDQLKMATTTSENKNGYQRINVDWCDGLVGYHLEREQNGCRRLYVGNEQNGYHDRSGEQNDDRRFNVDWFFLSLPFLKKSRFLQKLALCVCVYRNFHLVNKYII